MACPGDTFTHAILDAMTDYVYQSASTETTWHWSSLFVYINSDDRDVPKRFKRTAVQKPMASLPARINVSTPIFRGNKFQVGESKK